MERTYTVYVHVNKINGKRYVGQTVKKPEQRWGVNGSGYRTQVFYKAIQKYGWDNFDHIIIAEGLTKKEADKLERYYIREWKTNKKEYGYNISIGGEKRGLIHGLVDTRLYHIHRKMKCRCYVESTKGYKYEGAKGISVCPEWHEFKNFSEWSFKNGYHEGLFLFRKNKDLDYSPDNCFWGDKEVQAKNQTTLIYTYKGKTQSLRKWSKELGISYSTLLGRIEKFGMSVEEAFEKPVIKPIELTYHGETHSLKKWSKILGIAESTLGRRYHEWGNDPVRIFETPIQRRVSKKVI